ncbi:MAG: TonB-dependent receptor, partial [Flammeovirgaceae bacterium]|nr:TonB-dependent receptor [Flammeovirgaceae bacterium]
VYRPFLVRAGQQEGLSFVNPDMVKSIEFSSGGWQAKYGDKLSSVLNIEYKKPEKFGGSAEANLLGGSAHLEWASANEKITALLASRYKSAAYLLNTLETQGQYLPRFTDLQSYTTFDLSKKTEEKKTILGVLLTYANNNYLFRPETRETTFGFFNNVKRLRVAFTGEESMRYQTFQSGMRLTHKFSQTFISDLIASYLITREREFMNVENGYRLCDVDNNITSDTFNDCVFVRGVGINYQYARNLLNATILGVESRNAWRTNEKIITEFGLRWDKEIINDFLYEYSFTDSANFVRLGETIQGQQYLNSQRLSGYLQQTYFLDSLQTLTIGLRSNYWTLNEQLLWSPRLQYAKKMRWKRDIVLKTAVGLYQQPPFYREMRNFSGAVNTHLKAQQSLHLIAGLDYLFRAWQRPFRLISEVYYKYLWDVVAYDVDNVRLRYYANNQATAYVYGMDIRINGEFINGAESWFSLSLMKAMENLAFDARGFIRRPTDQRLTFAGFFQDHIPNIPSIRFYARALYGTGLPYGLPNNLNLRQALKNGTDYARVDLGFSKIIQFSNNSLKSIWLGLEILNAFGINNNISFNWVPDLYGNVYAVPNSLSQRFFNLKMKVSF